MGPGRDVPEWGRAPRRRPLVIAHRGASAIEPENSVAAFRRAAASGADGVELDVLCCATGEAVVFHDQDLARLANRPDRVAALSLADLRAVKLASGAGISTLAEALEACGPRLLVNIELKASRLFDRTIARLVERTAAVVRETGVGARVLMSSFHPWAVALWTRQAPDVPAALLFESQAPLPLRRAWALHGLRVFAVHPEATLCTPESVRRWHDAGYAVNTWTVDDPRRLRALRGMGVDGIITNDPAAARAALAGDQSE